MGGSGLGETGSIVGKTDVVGVALEVGVLEGWAVAVTIAVGVAVAVMVGDDTATPDPGSSVGEGGGKGRPPAKPPSRISPTPATA